MANPNELILVDGSSFLYRAYFAVKKSFTTKDGFPTGAIFVITRMLQNLLEQFEGNKIVLVFDAKGGSFRNQIYPDYKATRPPCLKSWSSRSRWYIKWQKLWAFRC